MGDFKAVGSANDVGEGSMKAFDVGDTKVAVASVDGNLYAFDNVCTHQHCPLAKGDLEGAVVTCPCHGSQFDVTTGAVLRGPAEDAVKSYPVRVEGNTIQIEI